MKIAHSDIKLENILVDDENAALIKIIDFGFSDFQENRVKDQFFGALGYMSP